MAMVLSLKSPLFDEVLNILPCAILRVRTVIYEKALALSEVARRSDFSRKPLLCVTERPLLSKNSTKHLLRELKRETGKEDNSLKRSVVSAFAIYCPRFLI